MKQGYKRIYFDKTNGNILDVVAFRGFFTETTIEQDITNSSILSNRNSESFDVLELSFEAYKQDFAECNGYRVNPETKELEFSYPDPNEPEAEPVYQKPLTVEVKETKQAVADTNAMVLELLEVIAMGGM